MILVGGGNKNSLDERRRKMKTLAKSLVGIVVLLALAAGSAGAFTVDFTVDSLAQPWDSTLNPSFAYGVPTGDFRLPPTIVDSSSGFFFNPGDILTISYVSGVTSPYGGVATLVGTTPVATIGDANGLNGFYNPALFYTAATKYYAPFPTVYDNPGLGYYYPTRYTDLSPNPASTYYLACLVGTFADATGTIVGPRPFFIGDGPVSVTIPVGATRLQMGINDDLFDDNIGLLEVAVSGPGKQICPCLAPLPGAMMLFSSGLLGLVGLTRKFQG
jgi:hypothetical protein